MWIRFFFSLMILVSILGCQMISEIKERNSPTQIETKIVVKSNIEDIRKIADRLGVEASQDKTSSDILTDIGILIDDSKQEIPKMLPDEVVSRLERLLNSEERKVLREYQRVIRDAQGKLVLYLPYKE